MCSALGAALLVLLAAVSVYQVRAARRHLRRDLLGRVIAPKAGPDTTLLITGGSHGVCMGGRSRACGGHETRVKAAPRRVGSRFGWGPATTALLLKRRLHAHMQKLKRALRLPSTLRTRSAHIDTLA